MLDQSEIIGRIDKVPTIVLGEGKVYIEPSIFEQTLGGEIIDEFPSVMLSIGDPVEIGTTPQKQLIQRAEPTVVIVFKNAQSLNCLLRVIKVAKKVFKQKQKESNDNLGDKIRNTLSWFKKWRD